MKTILLPAALALAVCACISGHAADSKEAQQRITVGKNVHVSAARPTEGHYETHAAAHPTDPSKLLATAIIYAKDTRRATIVYESADGGKTWKVSLDPKGLVNTGDPAVAYGPDGTGYFAALTSKGHPLEQVPAKPAHAWDGRKTLLYIQPKGASSWSEPVTMRFADREYITFDHTKGRYAGRIYVTGDPRPKSGFAVFTSRDGGRTFSHPGAESDHRGSSIGNAVVASDGTLVGIYADTENVRAVTSSDGGDTLRPSVVVDRFVRAGSRKDPRHNNVNHFLHLAIDNSGGKFDDRVYVAWPDRRTGRSQVMFTYSTDKGATWKPTRVVTDNPVNDTNDVFMPTLAVNQKGVVGLLWYDRRENPDNRSYYPRFSASLDGGETWLPSVRLSDAAFTAGEVARKSAFSANGGDTAGLAVDANGNFHPVWVHDREGVPQVYTAVVTVR